MNLDELRTVQSKERRKDSLQQLRNSFYQDVAAYIQDLRAERDRRAEQVDNPFSDNEVRRLSDELDTAEEVAEALYERRVGKVVKLASFAAADMSASEEGMTVEEQELFDDLVARIKQNKASVLDVLAGEGDAANAGSSPATETADSASAADTAESSPTPPTESSPMADDEPTTIGGANAEGATSPPTPPEADADDVLANAMGGAADSESASEERPPAEDPASGPDNGGTDAALGTPPATDSDTGDDGVPTPDGGSAARTPQSNDTPDTQATPSTPSTPTGTQSGASHSEPSQSEPSQPEATETPTDSAATAGSDATTGTAMATPEPEPASTEPSVPESTSTEPTPAESASPQSAQTGAAATAAMADPEAAAEPTAAEPTAAEPTADESAAQQSTQQPPDSTGETVAAETDSTPRTMVRITDDVGTIFGVDEREYTLQAEDVVTLPTTNADVLLTQDAATKLE